MGKNNMTVANQSLELGLLSGNPPEHREPGTLSSENNTLHSGYSWQNAFHALVYALTPEILQRRKGGATKRLGGTAYLDGLRGVAALVVCLHHLTVYTHKGLELCYGHPLYFATYNNRAIALPFLRNIFVGGHFSVMLFFCISGYVVPRRLISHLQEGRRDDFIESINSAVFRRPGRLLIPVSFTTLAIAMGWHIFGYKTAFGEPQSNIFLELVNWLQDQSKFYYFFRQGLLFSIYNFTTWTIPVELRGSMFMFVWLFATHQCTTRARILLTLGLTLWLEFGPPGAMYAAFFAGLLTAELDMLAASDIQVSLPWDGFTKWWRSRRKIRMAILHVILVVGMFLASQPSEDGHTVDEVMENCFGWSKLRLAIPDVYREGTEAYRWFWLFWAAWMVLIGVKEIGWVRSIFETSFAQCKFRDLFSVLPPLTFCPSRPR